MRREAEQCLEAERRISNCRVQQSSFKQDELEAAEESGEQEVEEHIEA